MITKLYIGILLGYGLAACFQIFYLVLERSWLYRLGRASVLFGFVCHTFRFFFVFFQRQSLGVHGISESLSFFAWLLVLGLFLLEKRTKSKILASFIVPLAFAFSLGALSYGKHLWGQEKPMGEYFQSGWFPIHIIGAFFGEALLALTAILAILYLLQEKQLKSRRPGKWLYRLPSLELTDHLIEKIIKWGFLFLTLGILSGAIWAHNAMRMYWTLDPKQLWALITWVLYASMIVLRSQFYFRGRKGAILAILGSLVVLFTFLGTHFIYGDSHNFWEISG